MKRQRDVYQMKEQKKKKTPEKELNNIEISNLLDAEFKTIVIRMLNEFRRVDELRENFNIIKNDIGTINKEPFRNEGYIN